MSAAAIPPTLAALEARLCIASGSLAGQERARAEAAIDEATDAVLATVAPPLAAHWRVHGTRSAVAGVVLRAASRSLRTGVAVALTPREESAVQWAASGSRGGGHLGDLKTPSAYGRVYTSEELDD
jgi:hypothetical protein